MIAWYLCPYDVEPDLGTVCRVCAIARYLPTSPGPDKSEWSCTEIQKGYAVVKVSAPQAILDTISADADFHDITTAVSAETIDLLVSLGYDAATLTGGKQGVLSVIMASRSQIVGVTDGVVVYGLPIDSAATAEKRDAQVTDTAVSVPVTP